METKRQMLSSGEVGPLPEVDREQQIAAVKENRSAVGTG